MPLEGCFPLAPSFDHAGPMERDVETCARMLATLASGFERAELGSLEDFEVGVAWLELVEPLVRAAFRRRRSCSRAAAASRSRSRMEIGAVFMREAAESHRGLFPEHAHAYGANVRAKLERMRSSSEGDGVSRSIASGRRRQSRESSCSSRGIIATVSM